MVKDALIYPRPRRPDFAPLQTGLHLHHIDGNPANNTPYNLVYITPTEHRRIHNAKLTKEIVLYIKRQLILGVHYRILASQLHISGGTIKMLYYEHTWKDTQLTEEEIEELNAQRLRNCAVSLNGNLTLKGVKMSAVINNKEKEVIHVKVAPQGHFVQTYLPANTYKALRIRSINENKTLHKYLEELITNTINEGE